MKGLYFYPSWWLPAKFLTQTVTRGDLAVNNRSILYTFVTHFCLVPENTDKVCTPTIYSRERLECAPAYCAHYKLDLLTMRTLLLRIFTLKLRGMLTFTK